VSDRTLPSGNVVERTLAVLELLSGGGAPKRLSDIAQRLQIPKSAAHRILSELVEQDWVEQDTENECYGLTLRMALLGQRQLARLKHSNLRQPVLDRLAASIQELVRLTRVQNDRLVWIGSAQGRRTGLLYDPDMSARIPLHATANGKVWLASLPVDTAVRIALENGMGRAPGLGPKALVTVTDLIAELDRTRARGWGLADEEAEPGVTAIAVAVLDPDTSTVLGTVSVASPSTRFPISRAHELVPHLRQAAEQIALAWYTPCPPDVAEGLGMA